MRVPALLLLLLIASCAPANALSGRASVVDGDTIEIRGQRVRLAGIDAPEAAQLCADARGARYRCGQKAALALADRIGARTVTCTGATFDRYARLLAICRQAGADLNGWLVEEGLAVAYVAFSRAYESQQARAQAARRGLWAGAFEMPWDFRRRN